MTPRWTPGGRRSTGRRVATTLVTTISMLAAAGGLAVLTTTPAAAGVTSVSFTDSSTGHSWTVPQGVSSITVDALGGSGNTVPGSNGGAGAHVVATLSVTPASSLFVHVAGNGGLPGGGANGGGAGSSGFGGGGGASDVRDGADDLASRVLVAGGGGGQGFFADGGAAGQAGGGDVDPPFIIPAQPGSQTAGGAGGVWISSSGQAGSLGQGGDNTAGGSDTSSGGGGGYYGGGGGAVFGSGAGGSSYVAPSSTSVSQSLGTLGAAPYVKISWTTPAARTITVTDVNLPADGTSTGSVTATIVDQYGQPVPGDTVTFTTAAPSVAFGAVTDNGDGTYTATVTASTTGGTFSLVAHDGSVTGSGSLVQVAQTQPQTITFTSTAQAAGMVGGTYTVAATGGDSGEPVTFSVDPSTTNGACTVSGSTVTFAHLGSCVIAADQAASAGYTAAPTATQTIPVSTKEAQEISITSQAPTAAVVTDTYDVTATGGGSGEPVTFSSLSIGVCTVDGSTVTFVAAGTCTVAADQAGNDDYAAAPQATQAVTVSRIGATVTVTAPSTTPVYGQEVRVTADVASTKGTATGTVQFAIDGVEVGGPVTLVDGSATSPALSPTDGSAPAGSHTVTAAYVPTDEVSSAPASGSTTVGVDQAGTTTAVSVSGSTLTATVAAVAPGSGTPTGTVTFAVDGQSVGTATLSGGVATLQHPVPSGLERHVSAAYGGDANFTASSDSTVRHDPTITARVTSPTAKSKAGWYRSPVTVSFTCTTDGSALTAPCPAPVVLSKNGAAQSVSRTITARDGGVATVTVTGIDIDRTAPKVGVGGVKNGGRYVGSAAAPVCQANDALSGVASCTLKTTSTRTSTTTKVTVTATATDKAGNTATTKVTLDVVRFGLTGASYSDGAYNVRHGKTYTMVALTNNQPHLLYAAPTPRKPAGGNDAFRRAGSVGGVKRWVLGITLKPGMDSHRYWNLGIKEGKTSHVLKLRVS